MISIDDLRDILTMAGYRAANATRTVYVQPNAKTAQSVTVPKTASCDIETAKEILGRTGIPEDQIEDALARFCAKAP